MKTLALITARGNSKRLPRKNVKKMGKDPLIVWTIRAALESGSCSDVLVSTDNEEIAEIAVKHGALVPWLRPAELASDTALSASVAIHAVDAYEKECGSVDALILLQPTSPFRTPESINGSLDLFYDHNKLRPLVSVTRANVHPSWCFHILEEGQELTPFQGWEDIVARSQDKQEAWSLDGSIYVISPERLRKDKSFISSDAIPFIIRNRFESIDIDTEEDFELAELYLERLLLKS